MMPAKPAILLVTPVWNDFKRLSLFGPTLAQSLAEAHLPIRWIIADDGSVDEEKPRLESLAGSLRTIYPDILLHYADAHRGKGSIIHEAWALAPESDWLAFVDADGSVSAPDMLRLIQHSMSTGESTIGIRKRTHETHIEESLFRSLTHHAFLFVARVILGLRSEDTQCGAKVIAGRAYREIAPWLVEDGLAFDCELLAALQLRGHSWREVPVTWVEKHGGKVKPLRDGWRMFRSLLRIRVHLASLHHPS